MWNPLFYSLYIINILIFIKLKDYGIFLFLIFAMLAPVLNYNGTYISYDLAFAPIIILLRFMSKDTFQYPKHIIFFFMYFIVLFFSTILSSARGYEISIVSLLGTLRIIFLIVCISSWKKLDKYFMLLVWICLGFNLIATLLQIYWLDAADFFFSFYFKPSQSVYAGFVGKEMIRTLGIFNNTAPAAFFLLSVVAITLVFAISLNQHRYYVAFIIAIICGYFLFSKTFLAGIVEIFFLIIIGVIFKKVLISKSSHKKSVIYLLFIVLILTSVLCYMYQQNIYMKYYVDQILTGNLLLTRYDSKVGVLNDMKDVIYNNIIFGVGVVNVKGEFIGDSLYLVLLRQSGIVGCLFLILPLCFFVYVYWKQNKYLKLILLIMILSCGIGNPIIFNTWGWIVLSYILHVNLSNVCVKINREARL